MKILTSILTELWVDTYIHPEYEMFENLSDMEKRCYRFVDHQSLPHKTCVKVYYKKSNIVIATKEVQWVFMANKFFRQIKINPLVTITPTKIHGSSCAVNQAGQIVANLLGHRGPLNIFVNKTLLRALITKGLIAIDDYKQQNARKIEASQMSLPYETLKLLSTDVDTIISRIRGGNDELRDLVHQSIILNRPIKHTWSDRKVHDIHMKWTREIMKLSCRNCSEDLIWNIDEIPCLPSWVQLINSERDAMMEGETMHHCLGSNYMKRISRKSYMAFHVNDSIEGDFTVGISLGEECTFDQAHKKCNQQCSDGQLEIAKALVDFAQTMYDTSVKTKSVKVNTDDLRDVQMPF